MNEAQPSPKTGAEAMPAFKMGYRVIPDYDKQELTLEHWQPTYNDSIVQISRHVLDLKDIAVRTFLISLGWIPPREPKKIMCGKKSIMFTCRLPAGHTGMHMDDQAQGCPIWESKEPPQSTKP